MSINEIKNNLVKSCNMLYSDYDILNSEQNYNCNDELGTQYNDNEIDNEQKYFGEKRNDKTNIYYNLIKEIKKYVIQNQSQTRASTDEEDDLFKIINELSKKLDKELLSRYNNKEHEQYNTLLKYYNDIDNNRRNQSKQTNVINTLEEMLKTKNTKLVESSYKIRLIIAICLVIIFVILLIIFIKF
jgi:hypothetical protein